MKHGALLVSNKYPFPADDGKKATLAGLVGYLVDRYGAERVTYVVIGRRPADPPPPIPCEVVWIAPPARARQAWNAALSLSGSMTKSLQEALTWSPAIADALAQLVARLEPRLLVLDMIRTGQYFEQPTSGALRVLFMDDLYYLRFKRLLDVSAANPGASIDPAGTFAPMLPAPARALLRVGAVRDLLYRIEMGKVERRELSAPRRFDRCLLVNPNEVATLRARTGRDNVHTATPAPPFAGPCAVPRDYAGAPHFLMFGSLLHPVYRASTIAFLRSCADAIADAMPQARIRLVGAGADDEVLALRREHSPRIEVCGFVEDVTSEFTSSCALLVPMSAAGGIKWKVLTALYYGLPVIATDAALDGIALEDGVDCIRENDVERFPGHMRLLCDVDLNRRLSQNSARIFRERYSREAIFAEYDALFDVARPVSRGHARVQGEEEWLTPAT